MASPVVDRRPSPGMLRVINPIARTVLLSPAARLMPEAMAVLEFTGRRTGRTYRIVVGSHEAPGGVRLVFTSARWAENFRGGAPATLAGQGPRRTSTGTLVEDPEVVASAYQAVFDDGAPPRALGLELPDGHRMTAEDVRAVHRVMIRIEP
jgi:hypothetical protein